MTPILVVSILSPLIPLITGMKKRLTLLWLYCLTGLAFELGITLFKRVFHINYLLPSNLYLLVECVFISFLFRKAVFHRALTFYLVLVSLCLFFVITTVSGSVFQLNHLGASVLSLSYIVFAMLCLYGILKEQRTVYLEENWLFWLAVAFILYSSGNVLIFLFRPYLIDRDYEVFRKLWFYLYLMLNILKNILIAVALYRFKPAHHERSG